MPKVFRSRRPRGPSGPPRGDVTLLRRWKRAQTRRAILELPERLAELSREIREMTAELRRDHAARRPDPAEVKR